MKFKKKIEKLTSIIVEEFHTVRKDINLFAILILAPLFYSLFYSTVYVNKVERNVPLAVVDLDKTKSSRELISLLDAHSNISIELETEFPDEKLIKNGTVQGILVIPKYYEKKLKRHEKNSIKVYLNTSRFLISNDLNKGINETIGSINDKVKLSYFRSKGFTTEQAKILSEPVQLEIRNLFNLLDSYGYYLIPAILILILHQTLLLGISKSIAECRENNEILEWKRDILTILTAKGIFYTLLYSVYLLLFTTIIFYMFGIEFKGSYIILILTGLLFINSVVYFGIFISSFFLKKLHALQIMALTSYPIFLFSGYSWKLDAMPIVIKTLSYAVPFTPYINLFTRLSQAGAGFKNLMPEILHLIILILIYFYASYIRIHKLNEV
ncbi:ABC transporter permease [Melioribacter sp. OK-6-Me]|uniref:ABC transporter permease n=1 Tax=unclassified Melioribacter TaxID=2627329 RepID=UPI003ED9AF93